MMMAFLFVIGFVMVGVVGTLSAMAGQLYERRRWERRLLEQAGIRLGEGATPALPPSSSRLDQIQEAVETIAAEVERVGEGQRFVTKLLAERRPERTPPSPIPGAVKSSAGPTS